MMEGIEVSSSEISGENASWLTGFLKMINYKTLKMHALSYIACASFYLPIFVGLFVATLRGTSELR